jgi:hypothetical protein
MANQHKDPRPQGGAKNGVEGEGSYTAARDYKESIDKFMDNHEDDIEDMARDAADALDSDEGRDLKKAEKQGLKRSKH